MQQRRRNIIMAAGFFLLFLFATTPKDFLHGFTGHEDTAHTHDYSKGLVIEKPHHHCAFLSFAIAPFDTPHQYFFIARSLQEFSAVQQQFIVFFTEKEKQHTSLRGPPVA